MDEEGGNEEKGGRGTGAVIKKKEGPCAAVSKRG